MKTWQVIDAIVISDAREAAEYGLMEAGAIGTETTDEASGRLSVAAYFDSPESSKTAHESVLEALQIYGFDKTALLGFQTRAIADQDWLAEWKKHWRPVAVGRFIISPPWYVSVPGAVATGSQAGRLRIARKMRALRTALKCSSSKVVSPKVCSNALTTRRRE